MSVIGELLARFEHRDQSLSDWSADRLAVRKGLKSTPVDTSTALAHSAVWSCVTLISDMIATFPWHAYRKTEGVRQRVPWALIDEPSDVVDPIVWRTQVMLSLLLQGNVFGYITKFDGAAPSKIEIVSGKDVTLERVDHVDQWRFKGESVKLWPFGPLWHLPGYVLGGERLGLSVLSYASEMINLGADARQFGSEWFTTGGHPSGLLTYDGSLTPDEAETAKRRFIDRLAGKNEPVVLSKHWSYEPIEIQAADSQFLDTIGANTADVARFFRVQPELIGASSGNSSITYANVEQRSLSVMQFTLGPWTARLETGLSRLLPAPTYTKANVDGFIRTDARTRSEIIDRDLRNGMLSLNEARALLDRPPVEGGDLHMWPPATNPASEVDDARSA